MKRACVVLISITGPLKWDQICFKMLDDPNTWISKSPKTKYYLALDVHVYINICKFKKNVYATDVANAAHKDIFMMNMLIISMLA